MTTPSRVRRFIGRAGLVACWWASTAAADPAAAEQRRALVAVDKPVYAWGETVRVTYAVPDDRVSYELSVSGPVEGGDSVLILLPAGLTTPTGVWKADSTKLFPFPDWSSGADPSRVVLEAQLTKVGQVFARAKFVMIRPITPTPGLIDLGDRRRFGVGEEIRVRVPGIEALHRLYGRPQVGLDLIRLGRVVPGGAVETDEPVRTASVMSLVEAPGEYRIRQNLPPAAYELRLMGPGYTMLDRVQFDVIAPPAPGALKLGPPRASATTGFTPPTIEIPPELAERLPPEVRALLGRTIRPPPTAEKPVGTPYDSGTPPTFNLEFPRDLAHYLPSDLLWLDGLRMGRGGALARSGAYPSPAKVTPGTPAELGAAILEPGEYEARLHVLTEPFYVSPGLGYLNWQYIVDTVKFRIGGTPPMGWRSTPAGPEIPYGDVKIVVDGDGRPIIGSPVTVSVTTPPALSLVGQNVWVSVHERSGYSRDCARYEEMIAGEPIKLTGTQVTFPAPQTPGRYEIRLYRGAFQAGVGEALRFPEAELLAKTDMTVVVKPLAGALGLARREFSVNDGIEVAVDIPADRFPHRFEVQLWRMPDRLPGGAIRPAHDPGLYYYTLPEWHRSVEITERRAKFALPPIPVVGNYELRLYQGHREDGGSRRSPFAVARLAFTVVDREAPAFPGGTEPRVADFSDWPEANDPLRGEGVWSLPDADCVEPEFPEPPTFRVVEWMTRDPEVATDDVFEPAAGIRSGYPFLIEARFKTAPPEHEYRITVGDGVRTTITRTADPLVFRTGLMVLKRRPSP